VRVIVKIICLYTAMSKGEADFVTSSLGLISFLMWHDIYPVNLTFEPQVACLYKNRNVDWAELIESYWSGERIPSCELSEYVVVAKRILDLGEIQKIWFREAKEAVKDLREDYQFPIFV
jgi:hypothetical protein